MRHILETEGPRSLFKGLTPTLMGVAPARAIYFATYSKAKQKLNTMLRPDSWQVHLCSAACAGECVGRYRWDVSMAWYCIMDWAMMHPASATLKYKYCILHPSYTIVQCMRDASVLYNWRMHPLAIIHRYYIVWCIERWPLSVWGMRFRYKKIHSDGTVGNVGIPFAGVTQATLTNPIWMVRTRLQLDPAK